MSDGGDGIPAPLRAGGTRGEMAERGRPALRLVSERGRRSRIAGVLLPFALLVACRAAPDAGLPRSREPGVQVEDDGMASVPEQVDAGMEPFFADSDASRPEYAYRCTEDALLDRAPAIPASDTAGLGATIQRHFPDYRLSTEREIGCRFSRLDGLRPEQQWGERWGSRRAWWIWSGDFDADGTPDRLTILTHRADPRRDKLVVLHGDGTSADLGEHGGMTIQISTDTGAAGTPRDRIDWGNFEKPGGGHFAWNARTRMYELVEFGVD